MSLSDTAPVVRHLSFRPQAPANPVLKRTNKKRKEPSDWPAGPSGKRGKKGPPSATTNSNDNGAFVSASAAHPERKSKNTAVYITGLPPDADADELVACFGKFGLIEEDDAGYPKVKLYARDDGSFSGDALVVYFKEESVDLAVAMLDDAELRLGEPGTRMRVQRAEFGHKHEGGGAEGGGGAGGSGHGHAKPRKTVEDRKRATRRIGKMQKCVLTVRCEQPPKEDLRLWTCRTGSWVSGTTRTGSAPRLRKRKRRTR